MEQKAVAIRLTGLENQVRKLISGLMEFRLPQSGHCVLIGKQLEYKKINHIGRTTMKHLLLILCAVFFLAEASQAATINATTTSAVPTDKENQTELREYSLSSVAVSTTQVFRIAAPDTFGQVLRMFIHTDSEDYNARLASEEDAGEFSAYNIIKYEVDTYSWEQDFSSENVYSNRETPQTKYLWITIVNNSAGTATGTGTVKILFGRK
jgi:hypothetical protein